MAVLPRYISAGNRPADGPLLGGGRSAVISDELEQNRFWFCWWSKMNCGPSGPWGRTVRLLLKILGQKHCGFCVCSRFELRTVRLWGADSPPVTSRFSQRRLQIGWFEVLNRGQSACGRTI